MSTTAAVALYGLSMITPPLITQVCTLLIPPISVALAQAQNGGYGGGYGGFNGFGGGNNPYNGASNGGSGSAGSGSTGSGNTGSGSTGFGGDPYSSNGSNFLGLSFAKAETLRTTHGILAALAFVIFFPGGAITIRLIPSKYVLWLHAACQILAYLLFVAAFGIGIYLVSTIQIDFVKLVSYVDRHYLLPTYD